MSLLLGLALASEPALAQSPVFYSTGGDFKPLGREAFTDAVHVVIEDPGNCGLPYARAQEMGEIGFEVQQLGASWCAYWPLEVESKPKNQPLYLKEPPLPGATSQVPNCYEAAFYAGTVDGFNDQGGRITYVILPSDRLGDGRTKMIDCAAIPSDAPIVASEHSGSALEEPGRLMTQEPREEWRKGEFIVEWPDGSEEEVEYVGEELGHDGSLSLKTFDDQYPEVTAYDSRMRRGDHYVYRFKVSGGSFSKPIQLPRYATRFPEKPDLKELRKATYIMNGDARFPLEFDSWDAETRRLILKDPTGGGCYEYAVFTNREEEGGNVTYRMDSGDVVVCPGAEQAAAKGSQIHSGFIRGIAPTAGLGADTESLVDPYGLGIGMKARLGVTVKARPGDLTAFADLVVDMDDPTHRSGLDRVGLRASRDIPTSIGNLRFAANGGWSMDPQYGQLNAPFAGLEFAWIPKKPVGPLELSTGLSVNNDFLGNQYPNLEMALMTEAAWPLPFEGSHGKGASVSAAPVVNRRLVADSSGTFTPPALEVRAYTGNMDPQAMRAEETRLRDELGGSPKAYARRFLELKALVDASTTDKIELSLADYSGAVKNAREAGDDWSAHQLIVEAMQKFGTQVPAELSDQMKAIEEGYGFVQLPPRLKQFPFFIQAFGVNHTVTFAQARYEEKGSETVLFLPAGEYHLEGYENFTVEPFSKNSHVQVFESERLKK